MTCTNHYQSRQIYERTVYKKITAKAQTISKNLLYIPVY